MSDHTYLIDYGPRLRVRDVVSWSGFDIRLLSGEAGLDRAVRWAQATELLDPSPYLRGGELILTTGVMLGDDDIAPFVRALAQAEVAAIGYGVGVVGPHAPPRLVEEGIRHGIPVFSVPAHVPFVSFTERLAQEQADLQTEARDRATTGTVLDYVRRGLASPSIILDRFPHLRELPRELSALCFSDQEPAIALAPRPSAIGVHDGMCLVIAETSQLDPWANELEGVIFGSGGPGMPGNLPRILGESISAYRLAVRQRAPVGPRALATVSGLIERLTAEQLLPFYDHIYKPLERYDLEHRTELLPTLRHFVELEGSIAETSKALFLHPNSVRNRLARIHEITGTDPLTTSGLVSSSIALGSAQRSRGRLSRESF